MDDVKRPVRVLVLCADIGEGHVTVARALVERLQARDDVAAVSLRTDLAVMGPRFGRFLTDGFHLHLDRVGWSYDLAYRLFFSPAGPRHAAHLALAALGGRGLRQTIAEFRADVVVTEYPVLSAALGQLRALGRLPVPVCSSISDPAGLYYWAHPGIDLHLLSWSESGAEVDRIAGKAKAVAVRPLIDRRFLEAPTRAQARARLALPADAPVVLVSGGSSGLGDLEGATEIALAAAPDAFVVALAGRSAPVQARLRRRFGTDPRVRVLGFTEQMPALLSAGDALVHTTGGTTALEARIVGCPLINFGTGPSHVREHAQAMADQKLAQWAPNRAALPAALAVTLTGPNPVRLQTDKLPDAADLVLDVARTSAAGRDRPTT